MSFKQGNRVEFCRTKEKFGSWFSGKIIYSDGSRYTIRYDSLLNSEGESVVENVCSEYMRPKPPPLKREEGWVRGDLAEVFDNFSWKVGKIEKVMKNNRFVVRCFGSIQLKEFHESNLRVLQVWQNNEWVSILEDAGDRQNDNSIVVNRSKLSRPLRKRYKQHDVRKEICLRPKEDQKQFKTSHQMETSKGNLDYGLKSSALGNGFMETGSRKRKIEIGKSDRFPKKTLSLLKQVNAVSSTKAIVDKKPKLGFSDIKVEAEKTSEQSFRPFSLSVSITEENEGCSFGSCGSNILQDDSAQNLQISFKNIDEDSFDDAGSSCRLSLSDKKDFYPGAEAEDDVHKLELHAYRSTVQAFYASGPLSWEQESLLTNLRLSLHISNEEHLLQLRQLLSSQVL